jgi:AcrR family transcriptional regulator
MSIADDGARKLGRRPGHQDTRAEIVAAARQAFGEEGYDQASLRAIARRAGVDPALVHHYFSDKAALFVEAMQLPVDPRRVKQESTTGESVSGESLVLHFIEMWDAAGDTSASFPTVAQAMCASPAVADAIREFLAARLGPPQPGEGEWPADFEQRHSLVASQLVGAAWARYVLRIEPLASAKPAQIARWIGPSVDRYFTAALD